MFKKIILFITAICISGHLAAQSSCNCEKVDEYHEKPDKIIAFLEASELSFSETLVNEKVDGIQQASYYYCEDGEGYLFIKLGDKERLYKDVPLEVWFELKFNDTMDDYYKFQIKYVYIPV